MTASELINNACKEQGEPSACLAYSSTLEIEVAYSFKTVANFYQTIWGNYSESPQ
jgi:hypothetical protein